MDGISTATEGRVASAPKGPRDENFPVASWLIARRLRPHVRAFYAFARAADDIADDPRLEEGDKIARLDTLARALGAPEAAAEALGAGVPGAEPALALAASLAATGLSTVHGAELLAAFRRDACRGRCGDWGALMEYCRYSAVPCARYLMALHEETDPGARAAADALATALQVINHIQDCQVDYLGLDRVYIPLDWMEAEGVGVGDLARDGVSPGLRRVLDRMLDAVDWLLVMASPLPSTTRSLGLALEGAVTLEIARRLSARLRRKDPLSGRVALSRPALAAAALSGLVHGLGARFGRKRA